MTPSDPRPTPETQRIVLSQVDDPRDVVHRAVASLARGGVVGVPTGTGYALAASALQPEALDRIVAVPSERSSFRPWVLVRGAEELPDWVPDTPPSALRIASRAWPGPLVMTMPLRCDPADSLVGRLPAEVRSALVSDRGTIPLCCPGHPFVVHLASLTAGPLVLREFQGHNVSALDAADQAAPELIVDDGPPPRLAGPSLVGFDNEGSPRLDRLGVFNERDLRRLSGTIVLFLCTGNTCRSPMAEALFKAMLAERLGCSTEELEDRGWIVLSAGLSAVHGAPAASHAVEVVRSFGGSLDAHVSRRVSPDLIRAADRIVVMTRDHLDDLLDRMPEAAPRVRLLDPEGLDIDDPVGSDLATYRTTAETIRRHLARLRDELLP